MAGKENFLFDFYGSILLSNMILQETPLHIAEDPATKATRSVFRRYQKNIRCKMLLLIK